MQATRSVSIPSILPLAGSVNGLSSCSARHASKRASATSRWRLSSSGSPELRTIAAAMASVSGLFAVQASSSFSLASDAAVSARRTSSSAAFCFSWSSPALLTASRAASTEANASLYTFRNASNSEAESPVGNSIFCRLACKASLPSNLAARSCNRLRRSKNAASALTFFTKRSGLKSSSFSNRSAQENAAFSGSTPPSRHAALASSAMKRSSPESLSAGTTVFMMSSKLSRSTAAKARSL